MVITSDIRKIYIKYCAANLLFYNDYIHVVDRYNTTSVREPSQYTWESKLSELDQNQHYHNWVLRIWFLMLSKKD